MEDDYIRGGKLWKSEQAHLVNRLTGANVALGVESSRINSQQWVQTNEQAEVEVDEPKRSDRADMYPLCSSSRSRHRAEIIPRPDGYYCYIITIL
jgi:hypothetical protein